jgi:hypothetical protein
MIVPGRFALLKNLFAILRESVLLKGGENPGTINSALSTACPIS